MEDCFCGWLPKSSNKSEVDRLVGLGVVLASQVGWGFPRQGGFLFQEGFLFLVIRFWFPLSFLSFFALFFLFNQNSFLSLEFRIKVSRIRMIGQPCDQRWSALSIRIKVSRFQAVVSLGFKIPRARADWYLCQSRPPLSVPRFRDTIQQFV